MCTATKNYEETISISRIHWLNGKAAAVCYQPVDVISYSRDNSGTCSPEGQLEQFDPWPRYDSIAQPAAKAWGHKRQTGRGRKEKKKRQHVVVAPVPESHCVRLHGTLYRQTPAFTKVLAIK